MDIKECISGLESLKDHCRSMVDEQDPEDIWRDDVEALQFAIEALRAQQEREKNEPKTNADRIRAMSDEDMIDLFIGNPVCAERFWLPSFCDVTVGCKECVADWLQQPAEVGGDIGEAISDAKNTAGGEST